VTVPTGAEWRTDGSCELVLELANDGERPVSEVVQVYLHDRTASVVRPVQQLVAAARVDLDAGEARRVRFSLHADLTSFTGRDLVRVVEPGDVDLWVGASSSDIRATVPLTLTGPQRQVGGDRVLEPTVSIERV
jgi:beta-xylosidase